MIKNYAAFYVGIAALALAVIRRRAVDMEDMLGIPGALENSVPGAKIWIGIAALAIIISLIPFKSLMRKGREESSSEKNLKKESPKQISQRIETLSNERRPDVPFIMDYTIFQAIAAKASDIHFDPSREGYTVRFRIDGMMTDIATIPEGLTGAVSNRLKVLSNLVVYEGFLPQDGRMGSQQGEAKESKKDRKKAGPDFRIAFMPTLHGERIVIRILGRSGERFDFAELGMSAKQQTTMNRLISEPQGMIILTGPTGSGKTTTIYAALRAIQDQTHSVRSIATLEDPIEYEIPGINQSQVNEQKNFTFQMGLRAILRQDPDVIMVGEIRDSETAAIAIQAGMTGHLIITTVHANSSAATFSRLLEMGVAPYSINTAVTAVIAQRLVRRLCASCRTARPINSAEIERLGLKNLNEEIRVYEAAGCAGCDGSGYQGRVAIYEILEVTDGIRSLVAKGASAGEIHAQARKENMMTLFDSGLQAVIKGVTSTEEIIRVIKKDSI